MSEAHTDEATSVPLRRGEKGFLRVMGFPFLVEVLGVNGKEVWVSFPGSDYPLDGTGAELEFHTPAGYVLYHTQVIRGPRREGDGVVLERAETAEERKHRRHWRVPTDTTIVVRPLDSQKHYTAIMDNLSSGGTLIRTYAVFYLPCEVAVQIPLDDGTTHTLQGRVVYGEENSPFDPGPRHRYGISFTQMNAETKRALTWYLYKRLRKLYPQDVAG
ncbi:MAG: PilZ domain-containing protein, partial [Candidatus Hydrogenedentes bacterium]|nr:PilZ domain-containing protein [Candidatus Hydrogenedentota bacterium]